MEYLGHKISGEGVQPTDEKVRAIKEAPTPQNVSQLRSFLGLINYYAKFLPDLSSVLAPLYKLLQKSARWTWGPSQQRAFAESKSQLSTSRLLVHYDLDKPAVLSCDASPYGLGAVLSQVVDGVEKPVAFASRSLAPAEKKYAQIDKEGLAVVFGVKKFHQYLFGRRFTIYTDHPPLQKLFGESLPVSPLASARIQRWALMLSAYDYTIRYRPGRGHANADLFSRLPLPETLRDVPMPADTVLLMETLHSTPVHFKQIKIWTDSVLARVKGTWYSMGG